MTNSEHWFIRFTTTSRRIKHSVGIQWHHNQKMQQRVTDQCASSCVHRSTASCWSLCHTTGTWTACVRCGCSCESAAGICIGSARCSSEMAHNWSLWHKVFAVEYYKMQFIWIWALLQNLLWQILAIKERVQQGENCLFFALLCNMWYVLQLKKSNSNLTKIKPSKPFCDFLAKSYMRFDTATG